MRDVCLIEVAPLIESGVQSRIDLENGSVISRRPFDEMIRDIERDWIQTSVLEINNDYLDITGRLARCGRNV